MCIRDSRGGAGSTSPEACALLGQSPCKSRRLPGATPRKRNAHYRDRRAARTFAPIQPDGAASSARFPASGR
eukprot:5540712-Alexandrium_andersonii.AAC.1